MTQWGWVVLYTLFMAFVGVVAGMIVNTVATLLLDPTCSRGLCDADLFGPYKLLTVWVPAWAVAGVGAWLIWRAGTKRG